MNFKRIIKLILITIAIILTIIFIYTTKKGLISALVPFVIALFLFFLLKPLCVALEEMKLKRGFASFLSILALLLFFAIIILLLIPPITSGFKRLTSALPDLVVNFTNIINSLVVQVQQWGLSKDIVNQIMQVLDGIRNSVLGNMRARTANIPGTVFNTLSSIGNAFISIIITFYLLNDRERISRGLFGHIPERFRKRTRKLVRDVSFVITSYVRGQLFIILIVATLQSIGLFFIGIPDFMSLGLIGGIFNIIPYFGPIIGAIPAVLVALTQSNTKALLVVLLFVAVQQLDGTLISPKIMEKKLNLHPLLNIFAILFAGNMFGIIGMLLAVPTTAILIAILKNTLQV